MKTVNILRKKKSVLMFPLSDSAHSGILPAYSNPKPADQAEVAGGSTCYDRSLSASLLLSVPFPFHSLFSSLLSPPPFTLLL